MKKTLFAALAGIICICFSCNDAATTDKGSDARQKNIAASEMIDRAFLTGDVKAIDSAVTDDFIDHTDQGDKIGRDSLKAMVTMIRKNFPDMKIEKVKELADDEFVFSWMKYSGTSDGSMGMPKGPYTMNTIEVAKFKDGKATEHWGFVNAQEMMKMMGGQGHDMGNMNSTDTTKAKLKF